LRCKTNGVDCGRYTGGATGDFLIGDTAAFSCAVADACTFGMFRVTFGLLICIPGIFVRWFIE